MRFDEIGRRSSKRAPPPFRDIFPKTASTVFGKIIYEFFPAELKSEPVVNAAANPSGADFPVTFLEAEAQSAIYHSLVPRPGLGVDLFFAAVKKILYERPEGARAEPASPIGGLGNFNSDGAESALSLF